MANKKTIAKQIGTKLKQKELPLEHKSPIQVKPIGDKSYHLVGADFVPPVEHLTDEDLYTAIDKANPQEKEIEALGTTINILKREIDLLTKKNSRQNIILQINILLIELAKID